MSDFANDLLLQIHEQQVKNSETLGRIEATMTAHIDNETPLMRSFQADLEGLKAHRWKQTGVVSAVSLVLPPSIYALMRKLGF